MCLLVDLVKLSVLAKWLARKTPLRKPNRGEGIISIKPRLKRAYGCVGLLYYFIVLLRDIYVLPRPYVIHFWSDSLVMCTECQWPTSFAARSSPTEFVHLETGNPNNYTLRQAIFIVTRFRGCSLLILWQTLESPWILNLKFPGPAKLLKKTLVLEKLCKMGCSNLIILPWKVCGLNQQLENVLLFRESARCLVWNDPFSSIFLQ